MILNCRQHFMVHFTLNKKSNNYNIFYCLISTQNTPISRFSCQNICINRYSVFNWKVAKTTTFWRRGQRSLNALQSAINLLVRLFCKYMQSNLKLCPLQLEKFINFSSVSDSFEAYLSKHIRLSFDQIERISSQKGFEMTFGYLIGRFNRPVFDSCGGDFR